jgi:O-antigen ligase
MLNTWLLWVFGILASLALLEAFWDLAGKSTAVKVLAVCAMIFITVFCWLLSWVDELPKDEEE